MVGRQHWREISFQTILTAVMAVICFIVLYPVWYTLILSFNECIDAMRGGIYWWPRSFTLRNYVAVLRNRAIFRAFGVTVLRTVVATTAHVFFTAMVAYGLLRRRLIGRKVYIAMGTITLFFSGGLIPTFLVIRSLGLIDNFFVYVFPAMFNFYNLIIFQSFFRELPVDLEESARIDGANEFFIFLVIILPLSKPVLAVIALFVGVWNWNDFFFGVIYINRNELQPIQTFLYRVISEASAANEMLALVPAEARRTEVTSQALKLATMVVTTAPIVVIYPFLQKYFVKGLLLGSLKG